MSPLPSELTAVLTDASRFVMAFEYPISQSIPHIYLSALPFTPSTSSLRQLQDQFPNNITVESGRDAQWPAAMHVLRGHSHSVYSVAFSPDGKRIVSGSRDMTVRVQPHPVGNHNQYV
jgi:WD40 repeat protein